MHEQISGVGFLANVYKRLNKFSPKTLLLNLKLIQCTKLLVVGS